jgi:hypothetical protein
VGATGSDEADIGAVYINHDVNQQHIVALMRLLEAKRQKIEALLQLLQADEEVQRAQECLHRVGLRLGE